MVRVEYGRPLEHCYEGKRWQNFLFNPDQYQGEQLGMDVVFAFSLHDAF